MGISGLIPFCEKATKQITIYDIKGKSCAIDSYCLLHRGAYSCSDKLIKKIKTTAHIDFAMKFVTMLHSLNIKIIMVFDGRNLPAKAETEARRRRDRDLAKEKAKEFLRNGKTEEARREFAKAVDITHQHAIELMTECRKIGVECVTAMYEADGQLAYLNKIGLAEYVISEDSDLILFGCKKILFKLQLNGHCLLFEAEKLHLTMNVPEEKFCFEKFRRMCIISGCDYLDNLPGIGLAKARKFMMLTDETDMKRALLKIPSYLNMKKLTITDEYIDGFLKAEATFKFMYVYDPLKKEMCRLNPLEKDDFFESYCGNAGELLKAEVAYQLALGNINPRSLAPMNNFDPNAVITSKKTKNTSSIWSKGGQEKSVPYIKQQAKISSFFTSPPKHKQLAEVQNIIEQENDVSSEVEIDDLVSSYITTPKSETNSKRRQCETDDVENETSAVCNPFAKRQKEVEQKPDKTSLLSSLSKINEFMKSPANSNHRVISRFFVKKAPEPTLITDSEESSESKSEFSEINETVKQQKQKLQDFYDSVQTNEESSEDNQSTIESSSLPTNDTQSLSQTSNDEFVDLDRYEFKAKSQKQSFINDIKPKVILKPKSKSRGVGLHRLKPQTTTKADETSIQTKLSKFGFFGGAKK